jgi:adenylate cyclase
MANPRDYLRRRPGRAAAIGAQLWPTYLWGTGLLLLIIVALAGGIIWYNSTKSNELAVAAAKELMQEAQDKIIERIKLLYDPMYAIVSIASLVPQLTTPSVSQDPQASALLLQALRSYPQIQSLYVGFDDGGFYMVTHIAGEKSAALSAALNAPSDAAFAVETVTVGDRGERTEQWSFLSKYGVVIERREPVRSTFDPRTRPWYADAERSDVVNESDPYSFHSSGELGFTLSHRFNGPTPGVMGADLAAVDLADFLRSQKITQSSIAFIFTESGEVIAGPDASQTTEKMALLPKFADMHDPVIKGLVAAYQDGRMAGTRIYNVAGNRYIGRIVAIPRRYGHDQLLAIMVPIDEIEAPIEDIRNDTLLYSIAFVAFTLPLFVTLVIAWLDRRLATRTPWPQFRDDE